MTVRGGDILLVEDNPADAELARMALEEIGFPGKLHVVKDGEKCLAFLRRAGEHSAAPRPALVLLDLNLPRLDGRGVLRAIRSDPDLRRLPVIVMSSSDTPQDVISSYSLCSNCYVCKPVDLDEFFEVIEAVVRFWFGIATLPD